MKKLILDTNDINLDITLLGGQCFNWFKIDNNTYYGIFSDRIIKLVKKNSQIYWKDNIGYDQNFIENYLDINTDYKNIIQKLKKFKEIERLINKIGTIRILNQELEQTIISFIISQNNNIKRIKKILFNLSQKAQKDVYFDNTKFYLFPNIQDIKNLSSKNELLNLKLGYRIKYINDLILNSQKIHELKLNQNLESQKLLLKTIKGIGNKVADCILVFSLNHKHITPIDTWMKKYYLRQNKHINKISYKDISQYFTQKFKKLTAYAGQYIFEHERIYIKI